MIFEYDHIVRPINTDRREHPKDLSPTWMGDSIGKWEGDTSGGRYRRDSTTRPGST